jgi:single-strand DNA-binding protein
MNKCVLVGRLTRDVELKYTPNNTAVATFTLAIDRMGKDKEADFIPVVVWRQQAESCSKYLSKGRLVAVSGRIQVRNYDDKDGKKRYVTEVVADQVSFLERGQKQEQAEDKPPDGFKEYNGNEEDLPF